MSRFGRTPTLLGIATLALMLFSWWAPKGISKLSAQSNDCQTQLSPKGNYRVDICRPALPYFSFTKEMPRFVRYYNQRTQEVLGESAIVDLAGRGEIFWPIESRLSIMVGGGDGGLELKVSKADGG
jgi:hypothetical protein